jgi:hypothetical protein
MTSQRSHAGGQWRNAGGPSIDHRAALRLHEGAIAATTKIIGAVSTLAEPALPRLQRTFVQRIADLYKWHIYSIIGKT